jgi:transcriptional regulator with XRE-family HTH domain
MNKIERARVFRERLAERMTAVDMNRSALARACGVDRSTIAQLLDEDGARLPNAHLAAQCAWALRVSADWLLGLTERRETAADLLDATFRFADAAHTPADQQILDWHREAAGYKIRHVPATLPDLLKTEAVLGFEYAAFLDKTPEQAIKTMRAQIDWLRAPGSDYEICISRDMVQSLAAGEGYWKGLSAAHRREQIDYLATCCRDLYPGLRVYLYDSKKVFSAPVTVFGHLLAAVYIGRHYMVFREARQVRALTDHFDNLVRDADTDARSVASVISAMV